MTHKEKFIKCLNREPIAGLVPHFELVFYLTMESIGKVHPCHRVFSQWSQMSAEEQRLQIQDIAACYVDIAKKYNHSAIFVQTDAADYDVMSRILREIREQSNDDYFIMAHGDPTFPMPDGVNMLEFTRMIYEEPEALKAKAGENVDAALRVAERYAGAGLLDGFALCSDYCLNTNSFFTPDMFSELIAPYLQRVIKEYRAMDFYTIKHTDGNIMTIVDQMIQCQPHALHSLDPQGGVDLCEMRRLYSDKVALIGNVNCGLLQTGTHEECVADIRRSLSQGMQGYGYIFSTSNCAYTGLPLERYELMNRIWSEEGIYPEIDSRMEQEVEKI